MISIRHIGIYVKNMELMAHFYQNVFEMIPIVYNEEDSNELLDNLFDYSCSKICTTKLITPMGQMTRHGDMIELVKIVEGPKEENSWNSIFKPGTHHIAFGVDNIENVVAKVKNEGGKSRYPLFIHNNGKPFTFVQDIEGNWIELIGNDKT